MANIKETPQYQIYLEVLEAVKRGGYEIDKNGWQSIVKRGSEKYGLSIRPLNSFSRISFDLILKLIV